MPGKLKLFLIALILMTIGLGIYAIFKQRQATQTLEVKVSLPGINTENLIVLYKENDPLSKEISQRYQQLRRLPKSHVLSVKLPNSTTLSKDAFQSIYQALQSQIPKETQGFLITWQTPYRVEKMSITSAFALGYDEKWTQSSSQKQTCSQTGISPYFNHPTRTPWSDLKVRPTFMLTGRDLDEAETLIKRGIESDGSRPLAKVVLVRTSDTHRSSRWPIFKQLAEKADFHPGVDIFYLDASNKSEPDYISDQSGLLVYETGLAKVPALNTLKFLPGAIGDHLTSFGGQGIENHGQMSAFEWLRQGTTASYGTVVEPCNYPQKFPNPAVFLSYYLNNETVMESYWKSVKQPGEGLFIGEPLARPYDRLHISFLGGHLKIVTNRLDRLDHYVLEKWQSGGYVTIPARFNWQTDHLVTIRASHVSGNRFRIRKLPANSYPN